MKKQYNFWLDDRTEFNFENPYSACSGNVNNANDWAATLLFCNPDAKWCKYKTIGGRKEYIYTREEYNSLFTIKL